MSKDSGKSETALEEEKILDFWRKSKIFEKTEAREGEEFVFYDGPPFATGLPHHGHILAGTIKDAIPRFWSMRGKKVRRRWGWDCHGLPLENQIEAELGVSTKKDIEEKVGVEKFNAAARGAVLRYAEDWKRIIPRLARFVDMEDDYKTMDATYTESVWWSFKELYEKELIEKGFKAMHLCPRCGTTLSNFEVSQGYRDIQDIAVTVKLELQDEPGTYLLIWTTTPWTLPGNMAAAVNPSLEYVVVRVSGKEGKFILARERLGILEGEFEELVKISGRDLVGKKYKPPFDYFSDKKIDYKENAWKVYEASYVNLEEGTGIVHLAPAFGEEDLALAKEKNIPVIHHVDVNGRFVEEVKDFAGLPVKPKEDHQRADVEILKNLHGRGLLFAKEKITHSYPHCWRCDTPLLNYASTSWFVRVSKIKDQLIAENKKIHWVPASVGEFRFGNWLEGARDWAISRARYWGAPIPIWESPSGKRLAVGSKEDLLSYAKKSKNKYLVMRHGLAENNVQNIVSSKPEDPHSLTKEGRAQVEKAAKKLKSLGITRIITSPFARTRETAEIVRQALGLEEGLVTEDTRLGEINTGVLSGSPTNIYHSFFKNQAERFTRAPEGGENYYQIMKRLGEALLGLEDRLTKETVLLVTHETPGRLLLSIAHGHTAKEMMQEMPFDNDYLSNAEVREFVYTYLPRDSNFELDYHRPFIDDVMLYKDGEEYKRVPEVFDCWYESGSMPYAESHYPFSKDSFDPDKQVGFPADFIAEGLDQTRGWFYSLLVLGVALFGKSPYRNVVVNGLILAEDGQKMSKKLKNYPDPVEMVDRYGADALRFYLLSSPVVRGEDLNFSERGLDEVLKKVILRAKNTCAFWELFRGKETFTTKELTTLARSSRNLLDRWILARLGETISATTKYMEAYELDRAARPLSLFIDDLSTWYLRRSRERIKSSLEGPAALVTLQFSLLELSKLLSPLTPFLAEWLFERVKTKDSVESVHLSSWPEALPKNEEPGLILKMDNVREIASAGLLLRGEAKTKVRQPLQALYVSDKSVAEDGEVVGILKEEVNVKEVLFKEGEGVSLDTVLTPALKKEGATREIVRAIQEERKNLNLDPRDVVLVTFSADSLGEELLRTFAKEIEKSVGGKIKKGEGKTSVPLEDYSISFSVRKA